MNKKICENVEGIIDTAIEILKTPGLSILEYDLAKDIAVASIYFLKDKNLSYNRNYNKIKEEK